MKIMVWIAVLGLIAFPVLAVEMEKPSPEGLRIAADSARRGLTWLALSGGAVMAAEGGTKVKGNTILFHAPNGQLESIRLSDVDVTATKRLNTAVREGRWVDADTLAWAKIHVHTFTPGQVKAMALFMKAQAAEGTAPVMTDCGGGAAGEICMIDREAAYAEAAYKVLADEAAAKKH